MSKPSPNDSDEDVGSLEVGVYRILSALDSLSSRVVFPSEGLQNDLLGLAASRIPRCERPLDRRSFLGQIVCGRDEDSKRRAIEHGSLLCAVRDCGDVLRFRSSHLLSPRASSGDYKAVMCAVVIVGLTSMARCPAMPNRT